jgi:hypothetical protein
MEVILDPKGAAEVRVRAHCTCQGEDSTLLAWNCNQMEEKEWQV